MKQLNEDTSMPQHCLHLAPCGGPGGGRPPTGSPVPLPRHPAPRRTAGLRLSALPPCRLERRPRWQPHLTAPARE
jgi:hypothetical protein